MILPNKEQQYRSLESSPTEFSAEVSLNRTEVQYINLSEKFKFATKDFSRQFAHIYSGRLNLMRDVIIQKAHLKWGYELPVHKLSELNEDSGKSIVVGTLFKHQVLKPSILKEISEENQLVPQPPRSNYVSDTDQLILEDEVQRVRLVGDFNIKKLVTGIVTALLGAQNDEGKFVVEDYCFVGAETVDVDVPISALPSNSYIVLVSGLSLCTATNMLSVELLVDWITGNVGSLAEEENQAKVTRVIIAGNSVKSVEKPVGTVINTSVSDSATTLKGVQMLDDLLLQLVQSVEVDLMPGELDPSNHTLPQQGFHYCMLPKSTPYGSFNGATNPYECQIGGRRVLGSAGQPINDIGQLTDMEDPLEVLESTLTWGHVAPTAPDTLVCYPYYEKDPFVISHQPDIYFAGNQPGFATKLHKSNSGSKPVRLVCVPSFAATSTAVLLNLATLDCTSLSFRV